jgi:ATP-binding cassette subfamily C protein LapB
MISSSTADTKTQANLADPLSQSLTRLASMQGHAVPWHRFAMMSQTLDGAPIADLDLADKAIELWRARFPAADIFDADFPLNPSDAPALWVTDVGNDLAQQSVLVVCGMVSTGALTCVDAEGKAVNLSAADAAKGRVLVLRTDEPLASAQDTATGAHDLGADTSPVKRRSAKQWFRYAIAKRWRSFAEGALSTVTVNVIALGSSFYSMQVYDRVVPTQGFSTLWVLTVGVLMAIVLELVMRQVRNRLVENACKAIDEELSGVFFGHALAIRMDQRPRTVGTFAAQIRHFEMVRNFMTSSTLFIFADAPFALMFVVVIAMIAGPVAVVPLIFIPISILAGLAFRSKLAKLTELHMQESNRKNGLLIEAIDGIESVKAAGAEWKMLDRWRALTHLLGRDELAIKNITNFSTNLTQTLQQLSYVGLMAAGVYAINEGNLTVGGLIACTIISGRALSPLAQVPGLIVQWKHAQIALKGLDGIMAMPSDRAPETRLVVPQSCQGQVRLEKVGFTYSEKHPILEVSALAFAPGERVAILGAVGSGKSTLIKILSGLYKPSVGSVFLDNVDVTHLAPEFVREHMGYLPQDVRLFQGSLRENLTLGMPAPSDSQILRAAAMTGLDLVIQNHPKGMELEISEGGNGLSGGQRQLVGITRMLLQQPRIMLLDEPTASMDAQLENRVMHHLFNELAPQSLLVVVTHKPALLAYVNRVIVVDKGRIVLDGPRDAVLARLRGTPTETTPSAPAEATA